MKILIDGQVLTTYAFGKPGFTGGTESYVKIVATGLAELGHTVHVVAPDLDEEEQRGDNEWWWPAGYHPTKADVVVAVHNLQSVPGYVAEHFVLMPNGIDPWIGDDGSWGQRLSAVACFSQCHVDLLTRARPSITPEQCKITGLGVTLSDYAKLNSWFMPDEERIRREITHPVIETEWELIEKTVPGRMFFANDPARGLWHVLDIFDKVRERVPTATLHIGYDFDRQFEPHRWKAHARSQRMWDCRERIDRGEGIVNLGALTHDELIREQLECQVHVMPSDPENVGSQIHGLSQLECAAAGAALVLSDIEAFPELFADCATILPVPGTQAGYDQEGDSVYRVTAEHWADEVVKLMTDEAAWQTASKASREVAGRHDWSRVISNWDAMLTGLKE